MSRANEEPDIRCDADLLACLPGSSWQPLGYGTTSQRDPLERCARPAIFSAAWRASFDLLSWAADELSNGHGSLLWHAPWTVPLPFPATSAAARTDAISSTHRRPSRR